MSSSQPVLPVPASVSVVSEWPPTALALMGPGVARGSAGVEELPAYIDPGVAGFVIVSVPGFTSSIGHMPRPGFARVRRRQFKSGADGADGADDEAANC